PDIRLRRRRQLRRFEIPRQAEIPGGSHFQLSRSPPGRQTLRELRADACCRDRELDRSATPRTCRLVPVRRLWRLPVPTDRAVASHAGASNAGRTTRTNPGTREGYWMVRACVGGRDARAQVDPDSRSTPKAFHHSACCY